MKFLRDFGSSMVLTALLCSPAYPGVQSTPIAPWQQIDVPNQLSVTNPQGETKTLHPACAFSYASGDPTQANFHFFFKQGKSDRLVVYFNGGGACWNDKTCTSSLGLGSEPTFNPTLAVENTPVNAGGIFDDSREANPVKDWSMVFIPYCTGDIHIGSKDQVYQDVDGILTQQINAPVLVQHHGFDNVMAVREWVKNRFARPQGKPVKDLLITGSSAGAYGAKFNFPYFQALFPKADAFLLADAGMAVVTQHFVDQVFSAGGPWNTEASVATWLPGFNQYGNFNAATLNPVLTEGLSKAYPKSRIAEYTTAWDLVQTQFLSIMLSADLPQTAPGLPWSDIPPVATILGWHDQMLAILAQINRPNYRYYVGAGPFHTVLSDFAYPNAFYAENSANGVYFSDWVTQFLYEKNIKDWKSSSCTGDCGIPF